MIEQISNHQKFGRRVVFDKNRNVCMVQNVKRTPPGSTTFQIRDRSASFILNSRFFESNMAHPISVLKVKDDFICWGLKNLTDGMSYEIDNDSITIRLKTYVAVITPTWFDSEYVDMQSIASMLGLITGELSEIMLYLLALNDINQNYNLLPKGYGWDGNHCNLELVKANKVKQLLIGYYKWEGMSEEFIQRICDMVLYSPTGMIQCSWDKATKIDMDEYVYISKYRPEHEIFVIGQNDEVSQLLSNQAVIDGVSIFKPLEAFKRYVVVTLNVLENHLKNELYGVKIRLYEG